MSFLNPLTTRVPLSGFYTGWVNYEYDGSKTNGFSFTSKRFCVLGFWVFEKDKKEALE